MIIEVIGCFDIGRMYCKRDLDASAGEGPLFGFLRAADVYSGELPDGAYGALGRIAAAGAVADPPYQNSLAGVRVALRGVTGSAPEHPDAIAAALDKVGGDKPRAIATAIRLTFGRRRMCGQLLGGMGVSLFWWLRSADRLDLAPNVAAAMVSGSE